MSTTQNPVVDPHGQIVIEGPKPLVIDPTVARKQPDLVKDEALLLTAEIRRTSIRLWLLVSEAHDRKAHVAMGYETWDDYVRAELKMSPSRAYQLLDTGHVMKELAVAGADVEEMSPPPTRVIARIKDRLPDVRKAAREALKKGEDPDKALRTLARQPRRAPVPPVPGPASEEVEAPSPEEYNRGLIQCPACKGEGKVTRSLAMSLRAWLRKREEGDTG